ncbi:sterol carrier protein [Salinirubellus salinus]|uniref:Sterol carrier protein n=1 Tax=Salinirubellus salinus TaxID=1364945 RepID=A0A9E7R2U5_9EURY|nr:sterol carrier protein [Salinirubellus salinus]UWM53605.1 sterol carrier protein [Salinirubellus salinus]
MSLYPTQEWLEEYGRRLDENAALDDVAAGWGVGFDGGILLVITDVPVEETTLGDLPPAALGDIPEDIRAGVANVTLAEAPTKFGERLRPSLPAVVQDLLYQVETYVDDGTVYAYVGLESGRCTGVELLESPDDRETGFAVRATCREWQRLVDGRPALSALLGGDLRIEGNPARIAQYATVFHLLADVAAEVETTHLFPRSPDPPAERLLDEALRGPIRVQQAMQRNAMRSARLFGFR